MIFVCKDYARLPAIKQHSFSIKYIARNNCRSLHAYLHSVHGPVHPSDFSTGPRGTGVSVLLSIVCVFLRKLQKECALSYDSDYL